MSDFEYRLLKRIRDEHFDANQTFSVDERAALNKFQKRDVCWIYLTDHLVYVITDRGRMALQAHEERLQKEVEAEANRKAERTEDIMRSDKNRKEQFRHDWRIAIFSAVFGFVSGAVTDYFFNVVVNAVQLWDFLVALLH